MTLALLTFVSVFLLILSGGLFMLNRDVLLNRLATLFSSRTNSPASWARRLLSLLAASSLA